jgi:Na+/melibiose symporter-like transporter
MYASAIPIALSFYLLWNPPALSQSGLFYYLITMAVLVRTFLTFFEVPSTALAPELTESYDERTMLSTIRHFCGYAGGISIAAIAYQFLLAPTEAYPIGQLNPAGYQLYGLLGSAMMLGSILLSSAGTHHRIPTLKQPPPKQHRSLRVIVRETKETLSNRSFLSIFGFGIFSAMGAGFAGAMSIYIYTYFWALPAHVISTLVLSGILSAILAAFAAPVAARRMGKKHAAMAFAVLAGFSYPMPVVLRLFGMMPANGTDALIWVLVAFNVWAIALIISAATLVSAMMADIVEESELDTGRRSEGIFFAARSFISKSLTGLGIVFSAAVLEMIDFPAQARPSELDPDIIWRLGAGYAPLLLGLFLISMVCLSTYQLTREQHEANVAELEERARRI